MLGTEKIHTKSCLWLKHHHCLFSLKRETPAFMLRRLERPDTLARVRVVGIPDTSVSDKCWHKQKAPGAKKLNTDRPWFGPPYYRS